MLHSSLAPLSNSPPRPFLPVPLLRILGRLYAILSRLFLSDLPRCFDPSYYLDRYPDVRHSGIHPLGHFLLFGAREGRQPDDVFDVKYYLSHNPDVAAARANPLVHFLRYGWKEKRRPNPLFDADFYATTLAARTSVSPGSANPYFDYAIRHHRGERPPGWVPFSLPAKSYPVATCNVSGNTPKATVDVIIPVYSGLQETRDCLESILRSPCQTPFQVLLVNDHAPDPALRQYLQEVAGAQDWILIENSANLGFAASVNRGLAIHPDRDVVLLNNDTKVASDWLDRLRAAAFSDRIGTVTPFSNQATICSYVAGDDLPVEELDAIFREVNAGHRVRIPTAVGFCMYIRRECLDEVGGFRADLFGKGYGEENDFCMRALYKGWDHVLAADVFVYHAGETSFGSEAETRRKAGVETLQRLYPEYPPMIADHLRHDPARPYRVAVSAWRLWKSGRPVILSLTHNLAGGVEQYVRELTERLAGKAEMLVLNPTDCGAVVLQSQDFEVAFDVDTEYPALVDLLRHCGVSRLHVQHLVGHTLDVLRLKHDLNVPLDFSAHDYFAICPQVTLTDAAGRYCGEPDAAGCNTCLAGRPPWPRLDIGTWREKYGSIVAGADRVIAPSQDTADRLRRYFPSTKIVAAAHPGKAHPAPGPQAAGATFVIAILGTLTPHKGLGRLREIARETLRRTLPLRFVLIGHSDPSPTAAEPFEQTGPYKKDDLPQLLKRSGAQAVWFPAQWPETFSYTLSACLETGMPVIAPNLGAFAERLAGRGWSWVVPWDWDSDRMLEFFLTIRRDHFLTGQAPEVPKYEAPRAAADFYPDRYLS